MKKSYWYQLALLVLPIIISVIGAFSSNIKTNILVGLISIAIMFVFVFCFHICKRVENLWVFVISFFVTTLTNIRLIIYINENTYFLDYSTFIVIVASIVVFFILQSIEQIILGIITRMIRPGQHDFDDYS